MQFTISPAFASRLVQLIGRPTPNKHDHGNTSDDSWYTPYTGTYEPPPLQSQLRPSITYSPPLDAYSEQEQAPYSAAYPHPYSYQIPRHAEPDLDRPPAPFSLGLDGNQPIRFGTDLQNSIRPFLPLRGRRDWRVARRPSRPSCQNRTSITLDLLGELYDLWCPVSLTHTPHPPFPAQPHTPAAPCLCSSRIIDFSRDDAPLPGSVPLQLSSPHVGTDVGVPNTPSHAQAQPHPFRLSHRPSRYLYLFPCQST